MDTIRVTQSLYDLYNALNATFYNGSLPVPFITIAIGRKRRKSINGYFCGDIYTNEKDDTSDVNVYNEIMIAGERFIGGKLDVGETMLHEMAHLYCKVNNIKDITGNDKHNKKFRKVAEEHGLLVDCDDKGNWNQTSLNNVARDFLESFVVDEEVYEYFRNTQLAPTKPSPKKRLICPICGLQVQGKKNTLVKCAEHEVLLDYWDLTDPENPEMLIDRNEGLAFTTDGWFTTYDNIEEPEDEDIS